MRVVFILLAVLLMLASSYMFSVAPSLHGAWYTFAMGAGAYLIISGCITLLVALRPYLTGRVY